MRVFVYEKNVSMCRREFAVSVFRFALPGAVLWCYSANLTTIFTVGVALQA